MTTAIDAAINRVNKKHSYISDGTKGNPGGWDIQVVGDCEDYSFAVVWEYSDRSWLKFVKNVLVGPFTFHFVRLDQAGHFVTEYEGLMFDNNYRKRVLRSRMEANGFRFVKRYWGLKVLLKILLT